MKMPKIRTPHLNKEGRVFSWLALMYGLGSSMLLPIFPNFVKEIVKNDTYVGYFYSSMAIALLLAGLLSSWLFKRFSRIVVLGGVFVLCAFSVMFFVFANNLYHIFFLEFARIFAAMIIIISLALLVRDFTASKNLAKTEGVYFLFNNIGWFIGPIIGGIIARYFGYEPVFALSGMVFLASFFYLAHQDLVKKHPSLMSNKKTSVSENKTTDGLSLVKRFKKFFSNKGLVGAYLVYLGYLTFLSFKSVTLPLFISDQGYGSDLSGLIISLSILPYILVEIPIGKYADKKGLRTPIVCGFAIMSICFFGVKIAPWFIIDALFLILANTGSAFIEPLYDVYFFKNTSKKEEEELYGIFSTADPLGKFLGPLIFSISVMFLPIDWAFFIAGALFFVAGVFALRIKS